MNPLKPKLGLLGKKNAAHLLRRTTYNYSKKRVVKFASFTVEKAVEVLLRDYDFYEEPRDIHTGEPWIDTDSETQFDFDYTLSILCWWMDEALKGRGIHAKMTFFLHSNFVTDYGGRYSRNFYDYLALFRYYGLGNFRDLAVKISKDNLMLRYLDNHYNYKNNPNENYAREFLELFTIGKGETAGPGDYTNYTEEDIKQAARVLTGFNATITSALDRRTSVDAETGIPMGVNTFARHDIGDKTFSYAFQYQTIRAATDAEDMDRELGDFVDMVFKQSETARNICRKLYRYFVNRRITPQIEAAIIGPLAKIFQRSNFSLGKVLRVLLNSQHFYEESTATLGSESQGIGTIVKSPLELVLQMISAFEVPVPKVTDSVTDFVRFYDVYIRKNLFQKSDFNIFVPPNVAGYPAYYLDPIRDRNWFNSTSITNRYRTAKVFTNGLSPINTPHPFKINTVTYVADPQHISNPYDPFTIVRELAETMFCQTPDEARINYFTKDIFLDGIDPTDWAYEWSIYKNTGDDSEVKIALERLFVAMLYSPEYQLM